MTNRIGLAVVLLGVAVLVTASVGVSSVTVDRPIDIDVVEDDAALVGFEAHEPTVPAGNESTVDLLTVTNRAGTPIDVSAIEIRGANSSVDPHATDPIPPGGSATIPATAACADDATVSIRLAVDGEAISVERTVDVTIACEG